MFELLKDTQDPPSPLVQCCAKSGTAIPGSGYQEYARKLAINIEQGGRECKSNNFCDWLQHWKQWLQFVKKKQNYFCFMSRSCLSRYYFSLEFFLSHKSIFKEGPRNLFPEFVFSNFVTHLLKFILRKLILLK